MTERDKIEKLIALCNAYHNALDMTFAQLILATRGEKMEPFFPSRSPMWPTMVAGRQIIDEIEASLSPVAKADVAEGRPGT